MEEALGTREGEITPDMVRDYNGKLTRYQTDLLPRLEDQLQRQG